MVQFDAEFTARPKSFFRTRGAFPELHGACWRARKHASLAAEKWSARKTLAFIVLACGAFWAAGVTYLLT